MLLDCAEGSYGQMLDHFGEKGIDEALLSTRVVFITHIHGDHQLGVLRIMSERDKLATSESGKLFVVAPTTMLEWLTLFVKDSLQ